MSVFLVLEAMRQGAGALLAIAGLLLVTGGVLGVLRFPDFYTRVHAMTAANGAGAVFVLLGLAIAAPSADVALDLGLLSLAALVAAPLVSHLTANMAHAAGLSPLSGPYVAPRPGVKA